MAAYCNKSSIDQESVAFMFDGVRLRGEQTPGDVDMEDQDEIQVSVMHTSGPELSRNLCELCRCISQSRHGLPRRTVMRADEVISDFALVVILAGHDPP